jgi:hypothetical protein
VLFLLRYLVWDPAWQQREVVGYQVQLLAERTRFGGLRWYFLCPLIVDGEPCQRRAGKLYLPPGGHYFGCRRCYGLTYTSRKESRRKVTGPADRP